MSIGRLFSCEVIAGSVFLLFRVWFGFRFVKGAIGVADKAYRAEVGSAGGVRDGDWLAGEVEYV